MNEIVEPTKAIEQLIDYNPERVEKARAEARRIIALKAKGGSQTHAFMASDHKQPLSSSVVKDNTEPSPVNQPNPNISA